MPQEAADWPRLASRWDLQREVAVAADVRSGPARGHTAATYERATERSFWSGPSSCRPPLRRLEAVNRRNNPDYGAALLYILSFFFILRPAFPRLRDIRSVAHDVPLASSEQMTRMAHFTGARPSAHSHVVRAQPQS